MNRGKTGVTDQQELDLTSAGNQTSSTSSRLHDVMGRLHAYESDAMEEHGNKLLESRMAQVDPIGGHVEANGENESSIHR